MTFLLIGLLIGFLMAMPVGPVGILCIQRTIFNGQLSGILTGLGVACADVVYGSVAAFGLSFVYNFIERRQIIIKLIGAILLLIIGFKTLKTKKFKSEVSVDSDKLSLFNSFSSAFFITLTNPLTLFLFTGMLSWFEIDIDQATPFNSMTLVLGIFLGSFLWFLILSLIVNMLKRRFSFTYLKWMNNVSGSAIVLFSLLIFISIFFKQ